MNTLKPYILLLSALLFTTCLVQCNSDATVSQPNVDLSDQPFADTLYLEAQSIPLLPEGIPYRITNFVSTSNYIYFLNLEDRNETIYFFDLTKQKPIVNQFLFLTKEHSRAPYSLTLSTDADTLYAFDNANSLLKKYDGNHLIESAYYKKMALFTGSHTINNTKVYNSKIFRNSPLQSSDIDKTNFTSFVYNLKTNEITDFIPAKFKSNTYGSNKDYYTFYSIGNDQIAAVALNTKEIKYYKQTELVQRIILGHSIFDDYDHIERGTADNPNLSGKPLLNHVSKKDNFLYMIDRDFGLMRYNLEDPKKTKLIVLDKDGKEMDIRMINLSNNRIYFTTGRGRWANGFSYIEI